MNTRALLAFGVALMLAGGQPIGADRAASAHS
jgi:hypothetical protein